MDSITHSKLKSSDWPNDSRKISFGSESNQKTNRVLRR